MPLPTDVAAARGLFESVLDRDTIDDPLAILDLLQALNELTPRHELPPLPRPDPTPPPPAVQLLQARQLLRSAIAESVDVELIRQLCAAIASLDSALRGLAP